LFDDAMSSGRWTTGPVGRGASCDFERTARHAEERTSGNAQADRNTREPSSAVERGKPRAVNANLILTHLGAKSPKALLGVVGMCGGGQLPHNGPPP
jgi:hypothetical protein